MILYLLRHAVAVDQSRWRSSDEKRPLTPDGEKAMRKVAKGLKHLGLGFDELWSSPYVRARDTALILAKGIKFDGPLKYMSELTPAGSPRTFIQYLSKRDGVRKKFLLVGHEPYLTTLVSLLLGSPVQLPLDWKKAGLCRLDSDSQKKTHSWTLKWWLTPKLIKKF